MSLPISPGKAVRSAERIFAVAFLLLQPAAVGSQVVAVVQPAVRPQAVAEPVSPQQAAEAPVSRLRVAAEQAWRPQEEAEQVAAALDAHARAVPAVRPQEVVAEPVSPQQAASVSRLRVAAEQAWRPQEEAEQVAAAQDALARVVPTVQPAAQVASPVAGGASRELPQVAAIPVGAAASWNARWKAQLELLGSAALRLALEVAAAAEAPPSADSAAGEPCRWAEWTEPFGRWRVGAA